MLGTGMVIGGVLPMALLSRVRKPGDDGPDGGDPGAPDAPDAPDA
jgi:hypothetical protein